MCCTGYWKKFFKINKKAALISLLISAIYFCVVFLAFDAYYAINDDLMIQSILSGSFLRTYPFTYYFSVELGVIIAALYTICPLVPWLGIFFLFCFSLCFYALCYRALDRENTLKNRIGLVLLVVFLFTFLFLPHFVMVHYTVVAASVGSVGLILFITSRDVNELKLPVTLFLLTYLIRVNVFFLLIPFVFIAFIFLLLQNGLKSLKTYIMPIIYFAGFFILLFMINNTLLLNNQWKEYIEFNDIRTTLYDYTGVACDERAFEFYENNNLSEDDISFYQSYDLLLREGENKDSLKLIGDYGNERIAEAGLASRLKEAFTIYYYRALRQGTDAPYNYAALFVHVFAVATIVIARKYKYLVVILSDILYRSFAWMYLIFNGRYPERVTASLLIMELALLFGLIYVVASDYKPTVKSFVIIKQLALIVLLAALVTLSAFQLKKLAKEYRAVKDENQVCDVVYSYMSAHKDDFYFLDVYTSVARTEKLIKDYDGSYENYMGLGGWIDESPLCYEKLDEIGFQNASLALLDGEGCYLVLREGVSPDIEMFEKWIGEGAVLTDSLTSGDAVFNIYAWKSLD